MNLLDFVFLALFVGVKSDYWTERNQILANEASRLVGSSIQLSSDEQKVNDILMELKLKEFDEGFADPSKFLPAFHFFHTQENIQQSEVFKFIQKLPKGASLHSHLTAMLNMDSLIQLTYMEGLYGCDNNGTFKLRFFPDDQSCDWKLLADLRAENYEFDEFLRKQLSVVVPDPETTYPNINSIWQKFNQIFSSIGAIFDYRPFLHDYFYLVLEEFYNDNIRYLEIRTGLSPTYDSNHTSYDTNQTVNLLNDVLKEFKKDHTDFLGFRIINARSRNQNNDSLQVIINNYLQLKETFPDVFAGFDLVGQEDVGVPLQDLADTLQTIENQTNFYFHAGETNWYGTRVDFNILDAILLGTKRIGHAFAITKHPEALRLVKERDIAIELNPISNQVLKLVSDLRNHIGVNLIADGYPVVVTADDPSFWGAAGVSYDWYLTFMAMTPRDGDLRILKQLALNSFVYSSLDNENKELALSQFEGWWNDFIQTMLKK